MAKFAFFNRYNDSWSLFTLSPRLCLAEDRRWPKSIHDQTSPIILGSSCLDSTDRRRAKAISRHKQQKLYWQRPPATIELCQVLIKAKTCVSVCKNRTQQLRPVCRKLTLMLHTIVDQVCWPPQNSHHQTKAQLLMWQNFLPMAKHFWHQPLTCKVTTHCYLHHIIVIINLRPPFLEPAYFFQFSETWGYYLGCLFLIFFFNFSLTLLSTSTNCLLSEEDLVFLRNSSPLLLSESQGLKRCQLEKQSFRLATGRRRTLREKMWKTKRWGICFVMFFFFPSSTLDSFVCHLKTTKSSKKCQFTNDDSIMVMG